MNNYLSPQINELTKKHDVLRWKSWFGTDTKMLPDAWDPHPLLIIAYQTAVQI